MKRGELGLLSVLCFSLAAGACSSSPATTGGTSSGAGSTSAAATGGGTGTSRSGGESTSGTSGATSTGTGTSGGGGGGTTGTSSGGGTLSLPAGDCFTFSTEASKPYSTSCGDLMALTGARVDLSNGAGSSQLCLLSGSFASLGEVPSSYASCSWTSYVEGGGDLADQGLIVLDSTGTHHYRVWIASNALPDLVFAFAQID